jgi:hypothetical protein
VNDLISQVQAVLSTTAGRWFALTERLPAELLGRPAAPGEWSALGSLGHMLDTEHIFPSRVRALLAGEDIPAFDPNTQGRDHSGSTPQEMAEAFARMRAESLTLLDRIGSGDLERTGVHSELGPVTLGQLLHEWAAHDLMHVVQAERALMQWFIPGTGPWRPYFDAHDLRADQAEAADASTVDFRYSICMSRGE